MHLGEESRPPRSKEENDSWDARRHFDLGQKKVETSKYNITSYLFSEASSIRINI